MARTTLSRRIRRIGLLPQTKNEAGETQYNSLVLTPTEIDLKVAALRAEAKTRRKKAGK